MAIYAIRHLESGKRYIGSSVETERRLRAHRYMLRDGRHHSRQLQRTWDRDGRDAFVFEVIEEVADLDQLLAREQFHIDALKTADDRFGYNVCRVTGTRRGVPHSAETRAKMRAAHLGKTKSPEHRAKIGASQKGKVISEAQKVVAKANARRQWQVPEIRHKASLSAQARSRTPEARQAQSDLAKALMTPERRARMSEQMKVRHALKRAALDETSSPCTNCT